MFKAGYIFLVCFLMQSIAALGQQYRVCDVSSAPAQVTFAGGKALVRNDMVEGKDLLEFEKFSKISLMEMKSKEMFFFSGEGKYTVKEVVGKNRTHLKSNLKAHIKDLLQGNSHTKMAGVVYKDFASPVNYLEDSALAIADDDGKIVGINDIVEDGIYYFAVSNTSDRPYFVNVVRKGNNGASSACCISDDAMAQLDLFVPAGASVLLTAFPQIGKNLVSAEFKVVASEAPFDVEDFLGQNRYVRLLSPSYGARVGYREINVRFLVKEREKVKSLDICLNGHPAIGNFAVTDGINEVKLTLPDYGENVIGFNVEDVFGNISSSRIPVTYGRVDKPRLHVMSVGIGNYKNSKIEKLHYAASDAAVVGRVLDTLVNMNLHLYDKGGYKMYLTDEEATRSNILKGLDNIRYEANPEDVVMVYMSGHGKYVEFTSRRYFLPYDVEDDLYIESTAISYADLKAKFKQLEDKECKVVVFMDACYAGEMYFTKSANEFIGDAEPAVIGFYSSTRNQPSLEKVELGHGVFTYALLNGIKGGAVDSNGNVTISSLGDYITEQVRIESQGRQTPKVDNGGEDFILFKASDMEVVETGNADSVIDLARSYYTGKAVPVTMEDEFGAYLAAAELGDANSMYMAGVCCETGKGCAPDYGKALMWYGKAAAKGVPAAQYNLGAMHYNGTGVPESAVLAEKWFREADAKGYTKAAAALGHLYYHKETPDYTRAFEFFVKGAKGGDAMSLFYLGECHLYGRGTAEDMNAALDAYKKSAEKGYGAAKEKLLEIDY